MYQPKAVLHFILVSGGKSWWEGARGKYIWALLMCSVSEA